MMRIRVHQIHVCYGRLQFTSVFLGKAVVFLNTEKITQKKNKINIIKVQQQVVLCGSSDLPVRQHLKQRSENQQAVSDRSQVICHV